MKVEKQLSERDTDGQEVVVPAKTEKQLFATIIPKKGHTLWEINPFVGSCEPAVFKSVNAVMTKIGSAVTKDVIKKEKHIYISALNRENALRKFFAKAKAQFLKIHK